MNVVFMAGSHPRHAYIARCIAKTMHLKALVVETREALLPAAPQGLQPSTEALYTRHFKERDETEANFFGPALFPEVPTLSITLGELNTPKVTAFVNGVKPDLILSYGIHKLDQPTLDAMPCPLKWNIHGGLSPWYRGVITHFWPSYFLEPQMTGMTVHELTQAIDGGDVIHQSAAKLVAGDGVHALACRAVTALGDDMSQLIATASSNALKAPHRHVTTGRIWRAADWQPAHLHLVYDHYQNAIVDRYLDGTFMQKSPHLIRQF